MTNPAGTDALDVACAAVGGVAVVGGDGGRAARATVGVRAASSWARLAPVGLALLATTVYAWDLTVSGWANAYYSMAAQAASQSWSAWFFGSLDAANFITIDKPPAALWVIGLSVRLLGVTPFAILLPQALAGVATVLVLFATVRRQLGPVAGVVAGIAMAVTPVAAVMFRYDNPDALLVLQLVVAAWLLVRSLEDERLRWPVAAGVVVGFAFLTKYLQAYLVLPGFALTYLLAGAGTVRHRLEGLGAAAAAVTASSAWWPAIMELLPASARPWIGGSPTNSVAQLVLGYDGLGRFFGGGGPGQGPLAGTAGGFGGPGGPGGFGGAPGLLRMFNAQWAGEVSWLLPSAGLSLLAGLATRLRAGRTDRRLAAYVLWGSWGIVHVLVFSLMRGIAHPYYAVALAPAAAALTGAGVSELWRLRGRTAWAGSLLGALFVVTAAWALQVLDRVPGFAPGVGLAALSLAVAAALVLAVPAPDDDRRARRFAVAALVVGLGSALAGPGLYTAATVGKPLSGGDPAAGPESGRFGGGTGPAGGFPGDGGEASRALVDYLLANRGGATWIVAAQSANQAAPIQLLAGQPVMAMGGFSGSDPALTADALRALVRDGRLRFVLAGGPGGGPGPFGGGTASNGTGETGGGPTQWVTGACRPVTVAGLAGSLYDCAGAAG